MQCPKCGTKLSFAAARDKFTCPNCNAPLRYSMTTWILVSVFLGGVPWLVLEALVFEFRSTAISVGVFAVSSVIVAAIAAQVIKPKLDVQGTT